jgi:glycerophosphoryl diester phosphodiesterase
LSLPLRIAHRGMPRRQLENTLPSFSAALAAGADGIELDVHATSDGVVIVHHDPVLGGMEITQSNWQVLQQVALAPGIHVSTLGDVCSLVGGRAELFVEIKGAGIEDSVSEVLRDYEGPAAIHSFDHALIGRLAARGASHRLGLLYEERPTWLTAAMREQGALHVWPHRRLVTPEMIDEVHACGGRVIPWTVNDATEALRLASWGVDGLCTDDVTLMPRS